MDFRWVLLCWQYGYGRVGIGLWSGRMKYSVTVLKSTLNGWILGRHDVLLGDKEILCSFLTGPYAQSKIPCQSPTVRSVDMQNIWSYGTCSPEDWVYFFLKIPTHPKSRTVLHHLWSECPLRGEAHSDSYHTARKCCMNWQVVISHFCLVLEDVTTSWTCRPHVVPICFTVICKLLFLACYLRTAAAIVLWPLMVSAAVVALGRWSL